MMIPSERPWKWWNRTEYWRLYAQTHRQVSFKATHYFAADNKDHRNDQIGPVFHKVLPVHFYRCSVFQFQTFFLESVNFLKKCVSQQTRFRQGHLISYVHVQKEAGADDDSVHEGSQSPYCQPSISQFRNSPRFDFECFQFWSAENLRLLLPTLWRGSCRRMDIRYYNAKNIIRKKEVHCRWQGCSGFLPSWMVWSRVQQRGLESRCRPRTMCCFGPNNGGGGPL